jgi:hypothetical protein
MGWKGSGLGLSAGLCLSALALASAPARAVPIIVVDVPRLLNADVPLLPSGVLIFSYEQFAVAIDRLSVSVMDAQGNPVAGTLEELADGVEPAFAQDYVMWRPVEPFAASASYVVVLLNSETGSTQEHTFETQPNDGDRELDPALLSATLTAELRDSGEPTACCTRDDGQPQSCFAPAYLPEPVARVSVERGDRPVVRQLLFAVSATGGAGEGLFSFVDDRWGLLSLSFARAAQYCTRVEVYDAAARQRRVMPDVCVDHDPSLFEASDTEKKAPSDLALELGIERCHEPPAGLEGEWCEVNESICAGSSLSACRAFEQLCPSAAPQPDPMAMVPDPMMQLDPMAESIPMVEVDAGLAPGDPDADAQKQLRAAGCGCEVRPSTASPWPFVLALGLLMRFRRRARRAS